MIPPGCGRGALGLLGLDEIGQRQQIVLIIEGCHATHDRHDINLHARRVRMMTAEVQGVSAQQVLPLERRQSIALGIEVSQSGAKALSC